MISRVLRLAPLALALGLAGCPKPPPPEEVVPVVSPEELLARAVAEAPPGSSAAAFDLKVQSPDKNISANGALVVSPPGRFRVEVRGPIGPPQLVVVSDGTSLTAWLAGKNQLLTAPDAGDRIREWTGGRVGMEALASLLLGRLPALGPPDATLADGVPLYRWKGPEQSRLDVSLDPRTAHLAGLSLFDEQGAPLVEASVEGKEMPTRLVARIASKGITATLDIAEWKPANPPDAAFTLQPPPGVEVKPLELRKMDTEDTETPAP